MDSRITIAKKTPTQGGFVLYWMSREQRVCSNFALLAALEYGVSRSIPVVVALCVSADFLGALPEAFAFMGEGLKEVEEALKAKNIPFRLLYGEPPVAVADFARSIGAEAVFVDSDPLKIKKVWNRQFLGLFDGSVFEVDSRCVVPARLVSQKKEFAAYTIRPKITKLLPDFLKQAVDIPVQSGKPEFYINDYSRFEGLPKNRFLRGGYSEAKRLLGLFLSKKLDGYAAYKNDPTKDFCSDLSPYLHFGQISSLEVALAVKGVEANEESKASFLEELIVRRELAENFCLYCEDYDNENSMEPWAKANAAITDMEPREYIYSPDEFEGGKTHDPLWNAAQDELKLKGKIHGYMRMYWAKKILEWTPSTKEAYRVAVHLNDKYALDGRDPNGYAGIAWSIGGVHDRAWPSRAVFGKVRYMNYNGCKAKFKVMDYVAYVQRLKGVRTTLF